MTDEMGHAIGIGAESRPVLTGHPHIGFEVRKTAYAAAQTSGGVAIGLGWTNDGRGVQSRPAAGVSA